MNRVVNNGSKYITVVDTDGKERLLSTYDFSESFFHSSRNDRNRKIVATVAAYYGKQVGVKHVGATPDSADL
ncbi:hypothetical protein [uncultured Chryseobacterium sp.]|uniref:hypothetical protein n=1 Tax=uncultured Chryseobacterium sp. TaxID=259322 RepID=UPI0037483055